MPSLKNKTLLKGQGRNLVEIPQKEWRDDLAAIATAPSEPRFDFMTENHQRVRYFVVRELPRVGKPISPTLISEALDQPLAQVMAILETLEQNLFFLFRNTQGEVSWAYPVTAEETPHRLTFSSGEQIYAA